MSTLVQRTLSGAVYVAVIVGALLASHSVYFALFVCLMAILGIREFIHLTGPDRWLTVMSSLTGVELILAIWLPPYLTHSTDLSEPTFDVIVNWAFVPILLLLILSGLVTVLAELFRKAENPMKNWGRYWQALMMISMPFACMASLSQLRPHYLLALFISIWVNDTGAYLVGMATSHLPGGNHKMFVRVSPKKSWEGLIGGVLFNLAAGYVFYRVGWIDKLWLALVFVSLASVFGTLGDLMESLLKRTAGVKDSGHFMPGHGGVLDRFDSMLLAAPIITLLLFFTD